MALRTNLITNDIATYDNDTICLSVTYTTDGGFLQRTSVEDGMPIKDGVVEWYPSSNNFFRNYSTHDIVDGSFELSYTWTNAPTDAEVNDYIDFMEDDGHPNASYSYNSSNSTITMTIDTSSFEASTWTDEVFINWAPYTDFIELKFTSPGRFVCVADPIEGISTWNRSRTTIPAGESKDIEKAGNTCYFFVSSQASTPSATLETDELYKLNSSSINLTNHNNTYITVLRYHK